MSRFLLLVSVAMAAMPAEINTLLSDQQPVATP
jgi:hypothetical protein